ncbi:MAG: 6-phosphogluconolactonase, partial [Alistipes sp.]
MAGGPVPRAGRTAKKRLSFHNVVIFSLDEFFPISPKELQSRNYSMHESLLDHIDIKPENIHIPDGTLPQDKVETFCRDYEALIEQYDGIDLMVLGTGVQGQIGCNEPGTYTNTRTRLVAIGNKTARPPMTYGINYVPHKAITMGLRTILDAKRIILIAWGEEKAYVVKELVEGERQLLVPATCLQEHQNMEVVVDEGAASQLTRIRTPWLVGRCLWPKRFIRTAVLWLCEQVDKPILKLTYQDYVDNRLGQLLEISGMAYDEINIQVFNDLQHTITGWPGGKPNADDSTRPERAQPFPKRVLIFSPHPDDDVISMGGTFRRLITQGHDVHVAYE